MSHSDEQTTAVQLAQFNALKSQVPVLYTAVLLNVALLLFAFWGSAPPEVLLAAPAVLGAVSLARLVQWLRADRHTLSPEAIAAQLRSATLLAPIMSVGYSIWGAMLFEYGTPYQQFYVVAFLWMAGAVGAFCLAALPVAARWLILGSSVPFLIKLVSLNDPAFFLLIANYLIANALLSRIMRVAHGDFASLIESRAELTRRRQEAEAGRTEMTRMAFSDALTGLPNRRSFDAELGERLKAGIKDRQPFAVAMIDLDGFKPINDLHGHKAGDLVLSEVAARLSSILPNSDIVARLGGDEFGLILTSVSGSDEALRMGEEVARILRQPYDVGNAVARLTATCGFALFPENGSRAQELISRADLALYRAKTEKRGTTAIYSDRLDLEAKERALIEQELRRALSEEDLYLEYQPIYSLETGKVEAFEALARWNDKTLGPVSPAKFIPIAEASGLINELSDWLLNRAIQDAAGWPSTVMLAFNISAAQITDPHFGLKLVMALDRCNFSARRLIVEVTETAFMRSYEIACKNIAELQKLGIAVHLDDFGTGHSSLGHLQKIPFDMVKIDRSFISNVSADPARRHIVKAILDMCRGLEMPRVGEGVEDQSDLDFLEQHGCASAQGYFLSRPVSAQAAVRVATRSAAVRTKQIAV